MYLPVRLVLTEWYWNWFSKAGAPCQKVTFCGYGVRSKQTCKLSENSSTNVYVSYPLHRYEFCEPTFFPKTCKFSIILYSTWQISGGGQWRKACRSWKKESKQSEITWKQSEPVKNIFKIEKRREFVRALWYEQCPKNSFKRLYTLKGLLFWSKKLHFQKNFGRNFIAEKGVTDTTKTDVLHILVRTHLSVLTCQHSCMLLVIIDQICRRRSRSILIMV